MAGKSDKKGNAKGQIVIRKEEVVAGGHHGGSWKVAYADFVTAMMAFFLLMWLLNATTEDQRKGLADYFSPTSSLSHNSSGTGLPFGGRTAFSEGAMVSDRGAPQVIQGERPVVEPVDEDDSDVLVRPRPHRDDVRSNDPDDGGGGQSSQWAGSKPPPPSRDSGPAQQAARLTAATAQGPAGAIAAAVRGETSRSPTKAELDAELERREKQVFEQAAQQIREAVRGDPALAELARQLVIDLTPDGLRIQIQDEDRQPMFPFGSATPNDRARLLLQKVAPVLMRLSQDISIAGHTDAAQFAGPSRTNWELSAERANATRRLLIDAGLQQSRIRSVTGNADRDPLVLDDPLAAANRRIAIVVLRSVRAQTGEAAATTPVSATGALNTARSRSPTLQSQEAR